MVFCLGLEVVMSRGRRPRKNGGGDLEVNKQDVVVSDEAILLPYVAGGNKVVAKSHVVALDATIVEQNIVASDAAIA
jgi:hypothetical protein